MTRSLTHSVPEKSAGQVTARGLSYCPGQRPRLPKFVDHPELKGRWAYERLFIQPVEPTAHGPTLGRELHRFKRMHFCGRRICTLLQRYGAAAVWGNDYKRFAPLYQQLRNEIASNNLGLVYYLYDQRQSAKEDREEMLSEGMMALVRAIDAFNPWRGFSFSTYACNAIVRAFYRWGRQESKRRRHESRSFESRFTKSDWLDTRHREESILYLERLARIIYEGTADLTRIEKDVLTQRFPLNPKAQRGTFVDIGLKMNLCKERARQIENSALAKLRSALERDPVLHSQSPAIPSTLTSVPLKNTELSERNKGMNIKIPPAVNPAGYPGEREKSGCRNRLTPAFPGSRKADEYQSIYDADQMLI